MYLSRRLDHFTVSAGDLPLWAPVVHIGEVVYYRVDPPVFAWFERVLNARCGDPATAAADRAEIVRVWGRVVVPNVYRRLGLADLDAVRAVGGALPPVPELPAIELAARAVPSHLAAMLGGSAAATPRPPPPPPPAKGKRRARRPAA